MATHHSPTANEQNLLAVNVPSLDFRRPFTDPAHTPRQSMRLTNTAPGSLTVAFKVKTTAPRQYSVRPNAGWLAPGQTKEVVVLLQPMSVEPALDAKCKDKFLVQSLAFQYDGASINLDEVPEIVSCVNV